MGQINKINVDGIEYDLGGGGGGSTVLLDGGIPVLMGDIIPEGFAMFKDFLREFYENPYSLCYIELEINSFQHSTTTAFIINEGSVQSNFYIADRFDVIYDFHITYLEDDSLNFNIDVIDKEDETYLYWLSIDVDNTNNVSVSVYNELEEPIGMSEFPINLIVFNKVIGIK